MPEYKHPAVRISIFLIAFLAIATLYFHLMGYSTSLDWSLTTETDTQEVVAHQFQKGPFQFQIKAEQVVLSESYFGDYIQDLGTLRIIAFCLVLLGISLIATCATYLKQLGFLIFAALFVVFLIQLQLGEYFGADQWIVLIPFALVIGSGFYFHAYKSHATFLVRLAAISGSMIIAVALAQDNLTGLSLHFFANGILPMMIVIFLFLALIAEELLVALLYLLTKNAGGQSNHIHVMTLGGIYVANLLMYYLNKAGIFDFSFTFMNPYFLMVISTIVAIWSLRFKAGLLGNFHFVPAFVMVLGMGVISYSILGWSFAQGFDGVYESVHYLIIYTHLGFGFFFLAYLIVNFIDPLAKGFQVIKVAFKPQSFHYVTARLAGFMAILAFFFLSSQLALKMFQSARFNLKADIERIGGNENLAITYYQNAQFLGYNTHYPNYQLGNIFLNQRKQEQAKRHFENATQRFPSPQAYLNAGNLQKDTDLSKSKSRLETGLLKFPGQPELRNNLGIVNWKNGLHEEAYRSFKGVASEQSWNQAPEANKWGVLAGLRSVKDENPETDFIEGNLVVQSNIMAAVTSVGSDVLLPIDTSLVNASPYPLRRQAFLLNAMYHTADTNIHNLVREEMTIPTPVLQPELRKALAVNLYISGKIKTAFRMLDQMEVSKSGQQAGEILNEMGLFALDQNAPKEARDFFSKALEQGYEPARFNRLVAFLEDGDYRNAQAQLTELVAMDSAYASLESALVNVFSPNSDTTIEARYNQLYYRFPEYAASQIKEEIQTFDQASGQLISNRIIALAENKETNFGLDLQLPDFDHLDSATIVSRAYESPFDERLILAATEKLSDPVEAYNLLNESLEFNPYSIPLMKAKAMTAIDINLPEYAAETMIALSNLLSGIEFFEFEKAWYERKAKNEEAWAY